MNKNINSRIVKHLAGKHNQETHAGDAVASNGSTQTKKGKVTVKPLTPAALDALIGNEWRDRSDDTYDIAADKGVMVVNKLDYGNGDHEVMADSAYLDRVAGRYGIHLQPEIGGKNSYLTAEKLDAPRNTTPVRIPFDDNDMASVARAVGQGFAMHGVSVDIYMGSGKSSDYLGNSCFIKPKTEMKYTARESRTKIDAYDKQNSLGRYAPKTQAQKDFENRRNLAVAGIAGVGALAMGGIFAVDALKNKAVTKSMYDRPQHIQEILETIIEKHQAGKHDQKTHAHAGEKIGHMGERVKIEDADHAESYNKLMGQKNVAKMMTLEDEVGQGYIKQGAALMSGKFKGVTAQEATKALRGQIKKLRQRDVAIEVSATGLLTGGLLMSFVAPPIGLTVAAIGLAEKIAGNVASVKTTTKLESQEASIRAYNAAKKGEALKWDADLNLKNKAKTETDFDPEEAKGLVREVGGLLDSQLKTGNLSKLDDDTKQRVQKIVDYYKSVK